MGAGVRTESRSEEVERRLIDPAGSVSSTLDSRRNDFDLFESDYQVIRDARIETMKLEHKIFDIVVPTRNVVTVKHGKKEEQKEKIFPGYMVKVQPGPGNTGIEKEQYLWGYDIYLIAAEKLSDDAV